MGTHYFHTPSPWHPLLCPRCSLLSWELAAAERPPCGRIWSSSVAGDGLIFQWANLWMLVVSNMAVIFHFIYGMPSFPLTNSYFSRWLKPPTSLDVLSWRWLLDDYIVLSQLCSSYPPKKEPISFHWIRSMFNLPREFARLDDTRRIQKVYSTIVGCSWCRK